MKHSNIISSLAGGLVVFGGMVLFGTTEHTSTRHIVNTIYSPTEDGSGILMRQWSDGSLDASGISLIQTESSGGSPRSDLWAYLIIGSPTTPLNWRY